MHFGDREANRVCADVDGAQTGGSRGAGGSGHKDPGIYRRIGNRVGERFVTNRLHSCNHVGTSPVNNCQGLARR